MKFTNSCFATKKPWFDKESITPTNIRDHLEQIKQIVQQNKSSSQSFLIQELSPIIRGWSLLFKNSHSKRLFLFCDFVTFKILWKWACRRHKKKNKKWIQQKYFKSLNGKNWVFAYAALAAKQKKNNFSLVQKHPLPLGKSFQIRRHITHFYSQAEQPSYRLIFNRFSEHSPTVNKCRLLQSKKDRKSSLKTCFATHQILALQLSQNSFLSALAFTGKGILPDGTSSHIISKEAVTTDLKVGWQFLQLHLQDITNPNKIPYLLGVLLSTKFIIKQRRFSFFTSSRLRQKPIASVDKYSRELTTYIDTIKYNEVLILRLHCLSSAILSKTYLKKITTQFSNMILPRFVYYTFSFKKQSVRISKFLENERLINNLRFPVYFFSLFIGRIHTTLNSSLSKDLPKGKKISRLFLFKKRNQNMGNFLPKGKTVINLSAILLAFTYGEAKHSTFGSIMKLLGLKEQSLNPRVYKAPCLHSYATKKSFIKNNKKKIGIELNTKISSLVGSCNLIDLLAKASFARNSILIQKVNKDISSMTWSEKLQLIQFYKFSKFILRINQANVKKSLTVPYSRQHNVLFFKVKEESKRQNRINLFDSPSNISLVNYDGKKKLTVNYCLPLGSGKLLHLQPKINNLQKLAVLQPLAATSNTLKQTKPLKSLSLLNFLLPLGNVCRNQTLFVLFATVSNKSLINRLVTLRLNFSSFYIKVTKKLLHTLRTFQTVVLNRVHYLKVDKLWQLFEFELLEQFLPKQKQIASSILRDDQHFFSRFNSPTIKKTATRVRFRSLKSLISYQLFNVLRDFINNFRRKWIINSKKKLKFLFSIQKVDKRMEYIKSKQSIGMIHLQLLVLEKISLNNVSKQKVTKQFSLLLNFDWLVVLIKIQLKKKRTQKTQANYFILSQKNYKEMLHQTNKKPSTVSFSKMNLLAAEVASNRTSPNYSKHFNQTLSAYDFNSVLEFSFCFNNKAIFLLFIEKQKTIQKLFRGFLFYISFSMKKNIKPNFNKQVNLGLNQNTFKKPLKKNRVSLKNEILFICLPLHGDINLLN